MPRRQNRPFAPATPLDPLEPRVLMAALSSQTLVDALHLDRPIAEIANPESTPTDFGANGIGLGDITGDAAEDFAISAPSFGRVYIFSGADRSLIRTLQDGFTGFGTALLNLGDITGDGVPDLAVGSPFAIAPGHTLASGAVRLYSGANGVNFAGHTEGNDGWEFGASLALATDVTRDPLPELLVGAPGAENGRGLVKMFPDCTYYVTMIWHGEAAGDRFGTSITNLRRESAKSYAIGAPYNDLNGEDSGAVYIVTFENTAPIFTLRGLTEGDHFGFSVAALYGDTPSPILVVGAPERDGPGDIQRGVISFYNAFSSGPVLSATIAGISAFSRFGSMVANLGDLDGNGWDDLGVAAFFTGLDGRGETFCFALSGITSADIAPMGPIPTNSTITGLGTIANTDPVPVPGAYGGFVASADVDNDGRKDLISGAGVVGLAPFSPDVRAVVIPNIAVFQRRIISGVSEQGRAIWGNRNTSLSTRTAPHDPFIIIDGVYRRTTSVPGLAPIAGDAVITWINDSGVIAGYQPLTNGRVPFIILNGIRATLASQISTIEGPINFNATNATITRIGNGGEMLVAEESGRCWVYKDGVLTFLWTGSLADVTTGGTVLGTSNGSAVTWSRATGVRTILGVVRGGAINDAGIIVGANADYELVTAHDGVVTVIGPRTHSVLAPDYVILGINNAGDVLASFTFGNDQFQMRLFTQQLGFHPLSESVYFGLLPATSFANSPVALLENGSVVAPLAYLTPMTQVEGLTSDAQGVTSVAPAVGGASGIMVTAVNQFGTPVAFKLTGSEWRGQSMSQFSAALEDGGEVQVFTDPKDGKTFAALRSSTSITVYELIADGSFANPVTITGSSNSLADLITDRMTIFVSNDRRVHIAGFNADGDLILYYQGGAFDASTQRYTFFYSNLTTGSLEPQGMSTPAFVGRLVPYVTPWDGINIAGLDAAGNIHSVWWAPANTLWKTDNLSAITGAPALHGALAPYVTSWGGLNLAGTDANGDIVVTWWVPGFGSQWRQDNLTTSFGNGRHLRAESLTSYVTPWGGLNIAGIDDATGQVAIFWWTPTSPWRLDTIGLSGDTPVDRLTSLVNGNNLNLFGRSELSHVLRISWNPGDGSVWAVQDLTQIA